MFQTDDCGSNSRLHLSGEKPPVRRRSLACSTCDDRLWDEADSGGEMKRRGWISGNLGI